MVIMLNIYYNTYKHNMCITHIISINDFLLIFIFYIYKSRKNKYRKVTNAELMGFFHLGEEADDGTKPLASAVSCSPKYVTESSGFVFFHSFSSLECFIRRTNSIVIRLLYIIYVLCRRSAQTFPILKSKLRNPLAKEQTIRTLHSNERNGNGEKNPKLFYDRCRSVEVRFYTESVLGHMNRIFIYILFFDAYVFCRTRIIKKSTRNAMVSYKKFEVRETDISRCLCYNIKTSNNLVNCVFYIHVYSLYAF